MTRFDKHLFEFLENTVRDDPDKRWRALQKMNNSINTPESFCLYMDLSCKFETAEDLTRAEAVKMIKELREGTLLDNYFLNNR